MSPFISAEDRATTFQHRFRIPLLFHSQVLDGNPLLALLASHLAALKTDSLFSGVPLPRTSGGWLPPSPITHLQFAKTPLPLPSLGTWWFRHPRRNVRGSILRALPNPMLFGLHPIALNPLATHALKVLTLKQTGKVSIDPCVLLNIPIPVT